MFFIINKERTSVLGTNYCWCAFSKVNQKSFSPVIEHKSSSQFSKIACANKGIVVSEKTLRKAFKAAGVVSPDVLISRYSGSVSYKDPVEPSPKVVTKASLLRVPKPLTVPAESSVISVPATTTDEIKEALFKFRFIRCPTKKDFKYLLEVLDGEGVKSDLSVSDWTQYGSSTCVDVVDLVVVLADSLSPYTYLNECVFLNDLNLEKILKRNQKTSISDIFVSELNLMIEDASKTLSTCDLALSDYMHFIESSQADVSEAEASEAFANICSIRKERRQAKDFIALGNQVLRGNTSALKVLLGLTQQPVGKYKPRVIPAPEWAK